MNKPWTNEFPNDSAEGMDEAAVAILRRNMNAGRREWVDPGSHTCVSTLTADGHGAFCAICGECLE